MWAERRANAAARLVGDEAIASYKGASAQSIADLYTAAIDDDEWSGYAKLLCKATGIEAHAVWVLDENQSIGEHAVADGFNGTEAPYRDWFQRLDPWAASLARNPLETVMIGPEHMSEDELVKTEFYNDFCRPFGMFRPMGVKMQLSPGVFAIIGSDQPHSRTLFDVSDKPRLQELIPHIKRSLQLRRQVRDRISGAEIRGAALNSYAFGVIICDAVGRPVFVNNAAEQYHRDGNGIVLVGQGRPVSALVARKSQKLARFIADAAAGGSGGVMRLTGRGGAPELLVLVSLLPPANIGENRTGHVLVSLRPTFASPAFTEAVVAALFGLSPAQAAIAIAIYDGRSPEEIAAARGIRISTLRTHLAEIFFRTGTANQRELIRLLGMVPPLRR